jgi:hypothetical protein
MLIMTRAGLLICSLVTTPALAQVAGEDLQGPPPAAAAQPGQNQPGQNQPGQNQPGQNQPGQNQPGQEQPGQAQPHARAHRFIERFQSANTTGDGHLTLAQAQAGHMPMIVRNFDAIDVQHKGYVTLQDIRAYRQQMRATREDGNNKSD